MHRNNLLLLREKRNIGKRGWEIARTCFIQIFCTWIINCKFKTYGRRYSRSCYRYMPGMAYLVPGTCYQTGSGLLIFLRHHTWEQGGKWDYGGMAHCGDKVSNGTGRTGCQMAIKKMRAKIKVCTYVHTRNLFAGVTIDQWHQESTRGLDFTHWYQVSKQVLYILLLL